MRVVRPVVFLILIAMMLSTAGCSKIYIFDFTEESDIYRKDGAWSADGVLLYLSSEGLFMPNGCITAPHIYKGDLKATVSFLLDTDENNPVWEFNIVFSSDGSWYSSEGYVDIHFCNVGTPGAYYTIGQGNIFDGPFSIVSHVSPIPGMIINGLNRLVIDIKGAALSFWLNDNLVMADVIPAYYEADTYCLSIRSYQEASSRRLYYTSVKIEYEGTRILVE